MSLKLKEIDLNFLVFLLLVTQGNIQLKLVGIIIIMLMRPMPILKISGLSKFYIMIVLFHILYGLYNLFAVGFSYLINFLMVFIFWTISFIIIAQVNYFIRTKSLDIIKKTMYIYFVICVVFIFLQYVILSIEYKNINPYSVSAAAGDFMMSIFGNSSVSMIIMSFFLLFYMFTKKWTNAVIALTGLLMATYMSGTVLFLSSFLVCVLLFSKIKMRFKIYFVTLSLLGVVVFALVSPSNVKYAMGYINRTLDNGKHVPYKFHSFGETLDYNLSSTKNFLLGAGGGNFSSRVAFICSGEYVTWFPQKFVYASPEFEENHLGIWNHDFKNKWDDRNNTANQPFSFYNQLLGEYGFVGLFLFLTLYIGFIFKKWKILTYSKFMLFALLGYFLLDYWFEYFSVIIIFELFLMLDVKIHSNKELNDMAEKHELS